MASKKKSGKKKVQARGKRAEAPKKRPSTTTKAAKSAPRRSAPSRSASSRSASSRGTSARSPAAPKAAPSPPPARRQPAPRQAPASPPAPSSDEATQAGRSSFGLPPPDWFRVEGVGDERRRFQRLPREMKVRLFAGGGDRTYLECNLRSVDVSLSGVFLRSTFFLPEGTPVRLEIDVTGDHTAEATGTVARVARDGAATGFAIQFDRLEDGALKDLVRLFVGDRIEDFVHRFVKSYRGDSGSPLLWEGILAWELERLSLALDQE